MTSVQLVVDRWSSPTTVYTGGLAQLPAALRGSPMLLIADEALADQIDAVRSRVAAAAVVRIAPGSATAEEAVLEAVTARPGWVPVSLGGGGVMDLVRLAALARVDPAANGLRVDTDGVSVLPTAAVNPAVCIPSTIGTAAEVSAVAVRRLPAGVAMIVSPGLRAAATVLDPALTGTLPSTVQRAGLIEPWARVVVPAVTGARLRFQDGLARSLGTTLVELGEDASRSDGQPDAGWRLAAALASVQTHLGLVSVGRPPAGHALWPIATELGGAAGLIKVDALAALIPAWLRCLGDGVLSRAWGSSERVQDLLGTDPATAAERMASWLRRLGRPVRLPAGVDVGAVVSRVVQPWQASGLFLAGVRRAEIATVIRAAG